MRWYFLTRITDTTQTSGLPTVKRLFPSSSAPTGVDNVGCYGTRCTRNVPIILYFCFIVAAFSGCLSLSRLGVIFCFLVSLQILHLSRNRNAGIRLIRNFPSYIAKRAPLPPYSSRKKKILRYFHGDGFHRLSRTRTTHEADSRKSWDCVINMRSPFQDTKLLSSAPLLSTSILKFMKQKELGCPTPRSSSV